MSGILDFIKVRGDVRFQLYVVRGSDARIEQRTLSLDSFYQRYRQHPQCAAAGSKPEKSPWPRAKVCAWFV